MMIDWLLALWTLPEYLRLHDDRLATLQLSVDGYHEQLRRAAEDLRWLRRRFEEEDRIKTARKQIRQAPPDISWEAQQDKIFQELEAIP